MATDAQVAKLVENLKKPETAKRTPDKSKLLPRDKIGTRLRCRLCGRSRAVYRKFGICRICFRSMGSNGLIPGSESPAAGKRAKLVMEDQMIESTYTPPTVAMPNPPRAPGIEDSSSRLAVQKQALSSRSKSGLIKAMRDHPGSWIAWNEAKKTILAIADTCAGLSLGQVPLNSPEVRVMRAPGVHPKVAKRAFGLLASEPVDILTDVKKYWGAAADEWLSTPNSWFDGRKPRDLIGTEEEEGIRYLLRAIKTGIPA